MQKNDSKVVVVLGTGGTIAGLAATPDERHVYRAAQLGVAELVASVEGSGEVGVESEQVAQLDSKDMDFATWRALALRVAHHAARPEVAGVVVTHGTDTLEETAYFLSRLAAIAKPVVLTAAMRPASALDADGPRNLGDAIALAARERVRGVVVVFAGQVHAARDVRKVHPHRLDAFASDQPQPLGEIMAGRPETRCDLVPEGDRIDVQALPESPSRWPWVEIVTSVAGADGRVVAPLVAAGIDGIVVAGTGNGSVHRGLGAALLRARQAGVVVWRSTRCLDGSIIPGNDETWPSAEGLTPVKARIALMLDLLRSRRRR